MPNQKQTEQMQTGNGFIAALDQSGGSTPKALRLYGIEETAYSNDEEMYDMIHAMRSRIAVAPAFTGEKVIGAILFEMTMDREINGMPSAKFLWEERGIVPFLKIDKGLADEVDGVQLLKPMPSLECTLERAIEAGIFGTKMRSVINAASKNGIKDLVAQQFEIGAQIIDHGLMPIIEPEVTISISDKAEAEAILLTEILVQLDDLPIDQKVILKLTLPEVDDLYRPLVDHARVMRVVALSGGYDRDNANAKLALNSGVIASFSRALTEGLSAQQSDTAFNDDIAIAIQSISAASSVK
jgi:fructose-bisphosphate aldolase class I